MYANFAGKKGEIQ